MTSETNSTSSQQRQANNVNDDEQPSVNNIADTIQVEDVEQIIDAVIASEGVINSVIVDNIPQDTKQQRDVKNCLICLKVTFIVFKALKKVSRPLFGMCLKTKNNKHQHHHQETKV